MSRNARHVIRIAIKSAALLACAAALAAAGAGCGSDSSGETSPTTQAAVPTVTSPLETTSTPTATSPGKAKGQTTTSNGGVAPACSIPDAFQDFKYAGVACTDAVAVAQAWDSNGKDCNTVDNPNVDEGYHRTCSVEGYTCTAKRDVHSDGRFVTCTQGGQSIRFTWLPA
jgi:hypothetical protein